MCWPPRCEPPRRRSRRPPQRLAAASLRSPELPLSEAATASMLHPCAAAAAFNGLDGLRGLLEAGHRCGWAVHGFCVWYTCDMHVICM